MSSGAAAAFGVACPGARRVIKVPCASIFVTSPWGRPRFGYYLRMLVMLKREGWQVGNKRVYRLYCQQGDDPIEDIKKDS